MKYRKILYIKYIRGVDELLPEKDNLQPMKSDFRKKNVKQKFFKKKKKNRTVFWFCTSHASSYIFIKVGKYERIPSLECLLIIRKKIFSSPNIINYGYFSCVLCLFMQAFSISMSSWISIHVWFPFVEWQPPYEENLRSQKMILPLGQVWF